MRTFIAAFIVTFLLTLSTPCHSYSFKKTDLSRRSFVTSVIGSSVAIAQAQPVFAAPAPTKEELERIKIGYNDINDLVENFEAYTTVCRDNGGECKRNADAIRKALGLRSTTDPLFQINKVFAKVKNMDIDPELLETFFEASEEWDSAVSMSNSMAFISQFGEYNPGGGQDNVIKFLNESKKQLLAAQKALETIIDILKL
jgi:Ca2+ transporting ATPase